MARVLITGCGYVGTALGEALAADSHVVFGLRRHTAGLPRSIRPVEADLSVPGSLGSLPRDLDRIVYAVSPGGADDLLYKAACVDGLRNLLEALQKRGEHPARLLYVSSTGVYGQQGGVWVDEGSPTAPAHFTGARVLEGERIASGGPFPATALRFGGIYGPRRTGLLDRVRSGRGTYRADPPQYTNRIHLDDCVGVLRHLLELDDAEGVYLGVDSDPADERTVLTWLAGALGAPAPRPVPGDTRDRASRGNKRCRNDRLLASGYTLRHPTFREGYRGIIEQLR